METDSKEKILVDWNILKLEEDLPYRSLVFNKFQALSRYLKSQAKGQGQSLRKKQFDRNEGVNIAFPSGSAEQKIAVRKQKREGEKLTQYKLLFLKRIEKL